MAQCEEVTGYGHQCRKEAEEGSRFCLHHAGNRAVEAGESDRLSNYRLQIYQQRLADKAGSPQLKSLKDEIGILRMMIETRLNACSDEMDLMMQSSSIATMVTQVEKLVSSCHRMDELTKNTLDRSELATFANQVLNIIQKHVTDADALDTIASELLSAVAMAGLMQEG